MGQIASRAWKNSNGTLLLQPQRTHPCDWQDKDGSQAKQIYHCMVAGVELEKHAIGNEMLNQQSEKQTFPNTTQNWIAFGKLVATYNFATSLFCTARSLSGTIGTILDPASSCSSKVAILAQPPFLVSW